MIEFEGMQEQAGMLVNSMYAIVMWLQSFAGSAVQRRARSMNLSTLNWFNAVRRTLPHTQTLTLNPASTQRFAQEQWWYKMDGEAAILADRTSVVPDNKFVYVFF